MIDRSGYDGIEIPEDYHSVVSSAVAEGLRAGKKARFTLALRRAACAAAMFFVCLTAVLNLFPTVAAAASEMPVIGGLCRILTFREYHTQDKYKYIDARIPEIENTGRTELERRVNLEIQQIINQRLQDSERRAEQYYNAFVETGGDPESFIPVGITVDYEIKNISREYVSFAIFQYETDFSAYNYTFYYNIDMETGRMLTLKDWLGNDYKNIAARSIEKTIESWPDEQKNMLWDDLAVEDLITEETQFYINENGEAVVVFDKYEIAVGAAGRLEFTVTPEA